MWFCVVLWRQTFFCDVAKGGYSFSRKRMPFDFFCDVAESLAQHFVRPFSSQDGAGSTLHHDGFLESLFAGCSQFLSENSWNLPCWTSRMWSLSTRRLEFGGLNLQAFQVAFAEQQTCSIECTLCSDVLPFVFRNKDVCSVVCQCVDAKIEIFHGDRCGVLWQQCGKCLVGSQLQERDNFTNVASNSCSLFGRGDVDLPFFHIARSDLDLSVARKPETDLGRPVFEVVLLASLMSV